MLFFSFLAQLKLDNLFSDRPQLHLSNPWEFYKSEYADVFRIPQLPYEQSFKEIQAGQAEAPPESMRVKVGLAASPQLHLSNPW